MHAGRRDVRWRCDVHREAHDLRRRLASFPGAEEEEERAPGTHCLRMRVIIAKAAWYN